MRSMRRCGIGFLLFAAAGLTSCGATPEAGAGPSQSITGSTSPAASSSAPASSAPGTSSALTSSSALMSTSAPTTNALVTASAPASTSVSSPSRTSLFGSTVTQKPGAGLTLTGTVEAGVEPSCLLLTDETTGRRLNITGGDKTVVKVGARITVVGQIRTDLRSYCQQGPIFQVLTATVD